MKITFLLYFLIAVLTAVNGTFSSDESAKYIEPEKLFWIRSIIVWALAGVASIKMVMSTSYAKHLEKKEGNTQSFLKSDAANP